MNGYVDILPRGMFTPYVGAGIGFVYNQVSRSYLNNEAQLDATNAIVGTTRIPKTCDSG